MISVFSFYLLFDYVALWRLFEYKVPSNLTGYGLSLDKPMPIFSMDRISSTHLLYIKSHTHAAQNATYEAYRIYLQMTVKPTPLCAIPWNMWHLGYTLL